MAGVPHDAEGQFRLQMRSARETAKMTQSQLSALLSERGIEIDPSGIARIERGERSPRLNEAFAIAAILGGSLWSMIEPDRPPKTRLQMAAEVGDLQGRLQVIDEELAQVELEEGRAHRMATQLRGDRAEILGRLADLGAFSTPHGSQPAIRRGRSPRRRED